MGRGRGGMEGRPGGQGRGGFKDGNRGGFANRSRGNMNNPQLLQIRRPVYLEGSCLRSRTSMTEILEKVRLLVFVYLIGCIAWRSI